MSWLWRKSKSAGPVRVTATRRGLSTSIGFGPFRISRGTDGRTRRTTRIPGTVAYKTSIWKRRS